MQYKVKDSTVSPPTSLIPHTEFSHFCKLVVSKYYEVSVWKGKGWFAYWDWHLSECALYSALHFVDYEKFPSEEMNPHLHLC